MKSANRNKKTPLDKLTDRTVPAVSGAGTGTCLVFYLQTLPINDELKKIMIAACPTVAIMAFSIWKFIFLQIKNYIKKMLILSKVKQLHAIATQKLLDPSVSDEVKRKIHEELKKMHLIEIDYLVKEVEQIESF